MQVIVQGGLAKPVLLNTKEATAIVICSEDNTPSALLKFMEDGQGFVMFTEADKNFQQILKDHNLI